MAEVDLEVGGAHGEDPTQDVNKLKKLLSCIARNLCFMLCHCTTTNLNCFFFFVYHVILLLIDILLSLPW